MIALALLADEPTCHARYLQFQTLPANYMADFSLLAIVVDDVPAAVGWLRQAGYVLVEESWGVTLGLRAAGEIPRILAGLGQTGVRACFSDVADSVYQA